MLNYKKVLNDEQFQAANILDGPGLIIAGAGSGKTLTVTYRTARLIEKGINPENILLITFTNKAANEMKQRICGLIPDGNKVTAQTFHSFCANILRKYAKVVGYNSNYTIIDSDDAKSIIEEIVDEKLSQKNQGKKKGKNYRNQLPKGWAFMSMLTFIRNCDKNVKEAVEMFAEDYMNDLKDITDILKEYNTYKQQHDYLDYDDLLFFTNELFEKNENIAKIVANQYRYIMIDEYQDVNNLQLSLIKNMVKNVHNNVVVVGDDQQSIYAFRGANFKNIINFQKDFPGAKMIILDKNYRSTQGILNVANAVVNDAKEKFPKILKATNDDNQRPLVLKSYNQKEEAEIIIDEIKRLIRFGATYDDIAILSRTSQTQQFEMILTKSKIKYKKYGGMKIFATAHMKDVISYLKILSNINDELAWKRILKMIDNIGLKTSDKILEEIAKNGLDGLTHFSKKKFGQDLEELYHFLNAALKMNTVEDVLSLLIEKYDCEDGYYYRYMLNTYPKDYKKRLEDLNNLITTSYGYTSITKFLEDVILEGTPEEEEDGILTLSTIHSAKGLEWKYVFILDCVDGQFPSSMSKTDEEIEEERRIFYVAITRSKKELFFCVPRILQRFGKTEYVEISPFLTRNIQRNFLD